MSGDPDVCPAERLGVALAMEALALGLMRLSDQVADGAPMTDVIETWHQILDDQTGLLAKTVTHRHVDHHMPVPSWAVIVDPAADEAATKN